MLEIEYYEPRYGRRAFRLQRPELLEDENMTSAEADGYHLSALAAFPEGADRVRAMIRGVQEENDAVQDYLSQPLKAAIASIFGKNYAFLQGEDWERDRAFLEEDPNDPDLVSALAQKLLSQKHFDEARALIFDTRGKEEILRFPDDERMCILAARIYYKENNVRAIGRVLLDESGAPKFPENEHAGRLLLKYKLESGRSGNGAAAQAAPHEEVDELVYSDPRRLVGFTDRLLSDGNNGAIRTFFSARNPRLKESVTYRFVRGVLGLIHDRGRRDLLLSVCTGLLELDQNLISVSGFLAFYTRALNHDGQYEKSVQLLGRGSPVGVVAKFPGDIHCVKNLAYALISLQRIAEARAIIEAATARGLPNDQFFHLQTMMRGKPPRGAGDISRAQEGQV